MTNFTNWHKSSHSSLEGVECVEVATAENAIGIRDSKDPANGTLCFGTDAWAAFVSGVNKGEFG